MLEITKALCLSTAHISQETSEWLLASHKSGNAPVSIWEGPYGFFIPSYDATTRASLVERLPADLLALLYRATGEGCAFLRLDQDGPTLDDLPTFDW